MEYIMRYMCLAKCCAINTVSSRLMLSFADMAPFKLHAVPLLLALICGPVLLAQIPIAEARQQPVGSVVTVSGIVTNGPEFGTIRYMQDGTAGIAAFPGTGSAGGFSPSPGANITVTGILKLFNGLLELDPIQSFTINSTGNPLPEPMVITPSQIGGEYESRLVRITDAFFTNAGSEFTSTTWAFSSSGENALVFVRSSNPLIGTTIPFGQVDIAGIVSRFTTTDPLVGGYQLLPRGPLDLITSGAIAITSTVLQTDILPDGFTLDWTTNIEGTTGINYGTDASLGQQQTGQGTNTQHALALSGLAPATFYHAQAWSVAGIDTALSPIRIYSTASAVPGEIRVYFNQATDPSVATGPLAISLGSAMDDTIRAYIHRANTTIDVAVYNTSNNSMVQALNEAVDRGVRVRYIAEGSTNNSSLATLPEFPVHYRSNSSGSGMHHKFLAIDADDADSAFTVTGSTNFTNFGFFFDANNLVIVKDQPLTKAYRMEFEEMWGGPGDLPDPANSRFGADKLDDTPHLFNVNGTIIESRFSPSDGTTARISNAIYSADHHLEFAMFALTYDPLTSAMVEMHNEPGVTVRGILDDQEDGSPSMLQLMNAGIEVLLDNDENSLLHHKYAIVDRDMPDADPIVITGSHNWSFNAETHNDENTLFIHSADIASQFYQEWAARWITAVHIAEREGGLAALQLWPNPAKELMTASFAVADGGQVNFLIIDATGRVVLQEQSSGNPGANTIQLDVHALAPGVYMLTAESGGARTQRQFVRE